MDAYNRVKDLASRITYKPGWKIEIVEENPLRPPQPRANWMTAPEFRYINIYVSFLTKNINDPDGKEVRIGNYNSLCVHDVNSMKDEDVISCLFKRAIYELEDHEFKEWFKVDGIQIFDPHPVKKELVSG